MLKASSPAAAPRLLAASAVAASVTGTTAETALATVTIPAGAMGLNGGLHIYSTWVVTNSANSKSVAIKLGGLAGTAHFAATVTAIATLHDFRRIRNSNSASSQVGSTGATAASAWGSTGIALATSSIDTSVAVDLVFTGTLANTGETIALRNYEVWLVP